MMTSGGVCAVLDYELDQMTEYIADMAQRIALPGTPVSPAFRKFVSGLLSSTRLPSTTILLGMNLLARRTNSLNHAGAGKFSDGTVWRMLTIALLLGSKFLDDNTFQNRSWSEVSGIAVSELNTLEIEWLESMNWNLYVNLDESTDYNAWIANWKNWRTEKNAERKATLDRLAPLAPIDTNVARPRPYSQAYSAQPKTSTIEQRPPPGFHSSYGQNSWHPYSTPPHLTPPSAPDSTVHTPEYLTATGGAPGHQWTDWAVYNPQQFAPYQPPMHNAYVNNRVAAHHTPFTPYGQHYSESFYGRNWVSSPCKCAGCASLKVSEPYINPWNQVHPYGYVGQQLVA